MKAACTLLTIAALFSGCAGDDEPKRASQPPAPPVTAESPKPPPAPEKPRIGIGGSRIAFLHPKSTGGVLTELVEPVGH